MWVRPPPAPADRRCASRGVQGVSRTDEGVPGWSIAPRAGKVCACRPSRASSPSPRLRPASRDAGTDRAEPSRRVLGVTRVGVFSLLVLAAANGLFLYLVPGRAELDYAWAIGPPINAAFIGAGFLAGCVATALVVFRARSWRSLRILPLPLGVLATTLLGATHPCRPLPLALHSDVGMARRVRRRAGARDRVLAPAGGRRRAGAHRGPAANGAAGLVRRAGVGAGGRGRRAVRRAGRAGRALAVADHPPPRPRRRRLVPALRQQAADRHRLGAPVLRTTPVGARRIRPLEGNRLTVAPLPPLLPPSGVRHQANPP